MDGLRVFSRVSEAAGADDVPTIVHIHGFGISGRYMLPTATRLAADYPVHVPDLPGHGKSESPARLLGITGLADALAGYLDAVDVSRAVLLGNSLGCLVAAEFAHRYPERVKCAVLVSPAGGPQNRPLPRGAAQLLRDAFREPLSLAGIAIPDYIRYGLINSLRMFHGMAHYPLEARLSAMPVPFLGVVGMHDPLVSPAKMKHIFHSPADMELVYQFDAAHAINFSHPDALVHVVRAYLEARPLSQFDDGEKVIAQLDPDPADADV